MSASRSGEEHWEELENLDPELRELPENEEDEKEPWILDLSVADPKLEEEALEELTIKTKIRFNA